MCAEPQMDWGGPIAGVRVHDSSLWFQRLWKGANLRQLPSHRVELVEVGHCGRPLTLEHRSDPS
jgi:hypothetical protein